MIAARRQRIEITPHALKIVDEVDGQHHRRRRVAHLLYDTQGNGDRRFRIRACQSLAGREVAHDPRDRRREVASFQHASQFPLNRGEVANETGQLVPQGWKDQKAE